MLRRLLWPFEILAGPILDIIEQEIAPFDPPTPKTQTSSG